MIQNSSTYGVHQGNFVTNSFVSWLQYNEVLPRPHSSFLHDGDEQGSLRKEAAVVAGGGGNASGGGGVGGGGGLYHGKSGDERTVRCGTKSRLRMFVSLATPMSALT